MSNEYNCLFIQKYKLIFLKQILSLIEKMTTYLTKENLVTAIVDYKIKSFY